MSNELFSAIRNGDAAAVKTILSEKPELLMAKDETGVSPLLNAVYNQNDEVTELLLTMDPGLDIYEAAALGRIERVRELLDADSSLASAYSPDGWTALHLAAFFGHTEVVAALLDAGAGIDMVSNNMGNTALQAAVAGNREDVVKLLVERGADVDYRTANGGYAAIHNAASTGNTEIARTLIDGGADLEASAADGRTAADIARERHPELVSILEGS